MTLMRQRKQGKACRYQFLQSNNARPQVKLTTDIFCYNTCLNLLQLRDITTLSSEFYIFTVRYAKKLPVIFKR